MSFISRYVLGEFLIVFALALCVVTMLMLLVGLTFNLPPEIGAEQLWLILPFLLPEAVRNASQGAALFAACNVFGRLAGENGLVALSSLGISPLVVIRPVLVAGFFLSLGCVWLYDLGEAWGQREIREVVLDQSEAIAYRYLRKEHTYSKDRLTINVKSVEGRKLLFPTLIMEVPDQPGPVSISADEGELRTMGRQRSLSILLRNGVVHVGGKVMMTFPDTIEQTVPGPDIIDAQSSWPPEQATVPQLIHLIHQHKDALAHWDSLPAAQQAALGSTGRRAKNHAAADAEKPPDPRETAKQHLSWLEAQVNRRWTNGFFCLTFVMIGIPVSIRMRSRDYLSSFFACFLPIVLVNHPLHNFCIKMAEAGKAPPVLPWAGDVVLFLFGSVMLYRLSRH